jgi:hypothetical protein
MSVDWDLFRKADSGNRSALSVIQKDLAGPNRTELLKHVGDLGYQVEQSIFRRIFSDHPACQVSIQEQMIEIKRDLGYESGSSVERLMIQRICVCWLALHVAELELVQEVSNASESKRQERVDRAQRRYIQALKALASVRRLIVKVSIQR